MRGIFARIQLLFVVLVLSGGTALAQAACPGQPGALGVARTVEIDTSTGPLFGNQQYPENDFLADGEVVLTFDDGPLRPYTRPILEALDAHCTKATFFMVGRMAIADPEMVKEVAKRGHTVATHTWSHRNLRSVGPTRARAEVELGFSAISKALGAPISPFFRFPYLSDPKDTIGYLKARQMSTFSIDVDSVDFRTRSGADVQRKIMSQLAVKKKGILLFHDIQPSTAGGLRGLLDDLSKRGFKVVHLVAKDAAKTLPEYDAEAEQLLAKKRIAAVAQPLATRSVVWPIGTPQDAETQQKGQTARPILGARPRAAIAQPVAAPVPAAVPPQPPVSAPSAVVAPPAPPPQPRAPRASEERSWQDRAFGN